MLDGFTGGVGGGPGYRDRWGGKAEKKEAAVHRFQGITAWLSRTLSKLQRRREIKAVLPTYGTTTDFSWSTIS